MKKDINAEDLEQRRLRTLALLKAEITAIEVARQLRVTACANCRPTNAKHMSAMLKTLPRKADRAELSGGIWQRIINLAA